MIERLVLKDFKSHEDSIIDFNAGLNVFLGGVGAGKTSILEAVSFVLFGRYAKSVTQRELIRRGAEKSDISLIFSTNSGRYKVERTIYPEKTQIARLLIYDEEEWRLAVKGASAVSKSTEDLLGVDSSTFLAAIYASQGEIKEMLETQPGKRRERLDKLLGIDMYENIWRILGDTRTLVLNELTQAQEKASGVDVLERQREYLKVQLEKNKLELETLAAFSKEIIDRLQPSEQQLQFLQKVKLKLTQIETQIMGKNNEINNSSVTLKSIKYRIEKAAEAEKIFEENKEFIQLERDLETEKRTIETNLQQKKNLEALLQRDTVDLKEAEIKQTRLKSQLERLKLLKESLEALEKQKDNLPELKRRQADLEKTLDEKKAESVRSLNEIKNQNRNVERITQLGECPTCLQIVPEEHKEKIQTETKRAVAKLKVGYAVLEESRTQVQSQLEDMKERIELANVADRKYVETSMQVKMLEAYREEREEVIIKINGIQSKIRENREKIAEIKENDDTLMKVTIRFQNVTIKAALAREAEKQVAAKKSLVETFLQEEKYFENLKVQSEELHFTEKELNKKYEPKEHLELEKQVRLLLEDQAKSLEAINRLEKATKECEGQIEEAEKQLEDRREAQEETERLRTENITLEILRGSLREVVQPVMRKNNILKVSEAFQGFYQELSNDSIDYAAIDEEGNVIVVRNGEPSSVNSLSGGETTSAALAFRLAICSALTKNQLLLLDEPTIHLDEQHRAKLRDFLGSHGFEQLIVVTHDDTFDSLPAQIFSVKKRRSQSVVTPLNFGEA